jgi:hypothetical protein
MRFPNTTDDLITALDAQFPEVVARPGMGQDEIFHRSGQRSVINYLKQWRAGAFNEAPPPRVRGKGRNVSS